MCIDEGLAIAPWRPAGQGRFKSKAQIEERKRNNEFIRSITGEGQTPLEEIISAALEKKSALKLVPPSLLLPLRTASSDARTCFRL